MSDANFKPISVVEKQNGQCLVGDIRFALKQLSIVFSYFLTMNVVYSDITSDIFKLINRFLRVQNSQFVKGTR